MPKWRLKIADLNIVARNPNKYTPYSTYTDQSALRLVDGVLDLWCRQAIATIPYTPYPYTLHCIHFLFSGMLLLFDHDSFIWL